MTSSFAQLVTKTKQAYALLAQDGNYQTGRRLYGPTKTSPQSSHQTSRQTIPNITLCEIVDVNEAVGTLAAVVFACAVIDNGYANCLSKDLVSLGPWSWSSDVWTSTDAYELITENINPLRDQQTILNEYTFDE